MDVMPLNTEFNQLVSKEIIERAKVGDEAAFKVIYEQYSGIGYGIALRMVKHHELAQDVLQDAFISIFRHIKQYQGDQVFVAWLKRIVINQAINKLKVQNKFNFELPEEDIIETTSLFNENWLSAVRDINSLLMRVDDEYRTVFILHEIEGYKHKEIAELLEKSVSYSKIVLMRCYQQLKVLAEQ